MQAVCFSLACSSLHAGTCGASPRRRLLRRMRRRRLPRPCAECRCATASSASSPAPASRCISPPALYLQLHPTPVPYSALLIAALLHHLRGTALCLACASKHGVVNGVHGALYNLQVSYVLDTEDWFFRKRESPEKAARSARAGDTARGKRFHAWLDAQGPKAAT